jgi:diguanylate cyclase (GGDEF)-like protein
MFYDRITHLLSLTGLSLWLGILSLMVLSSTAVCALDAGKDLQQCRVDTWTPKDGLPPRTISAMTQTPDGYLWLATDAGLVRFDGVSFHVFNSRNTPGMTRDSVTTLLSTPAGLVVGTNGGGYGLLLDGRYQRYDTQNLEWSQTDALLEDRQGTIWAGGNGHFRLSVVEGKGCRQLLSDDGSGPGFALGMPVGFAEDKPGNLWIATAYSGLWIRRLSGAYIAVGEKKGELPSTRLSGLAWGKDGSLWIGTTDQGLCRYFHKRYTMYNTHQGLSSDHVQALCVDHNGTVWIGTAAGLDCWEKGRFRSFTRRDGLLDQSVSALAEDREGNLWAGVGTSLTRFANTKLTPLTLPAASGQINISGQGVRDKNRLWFATDHGLLEYQGDHSTLFSAHLGLPEENLSTVASGEDGTVWTLSNQGVLRHCAFTPTGGHILQTLSPQAPRKLFYQSITQDKDGLVLAASGELTRYHSGKFVAISRMELAHLGPAGVTFQPWHPQPWKDLFGYVFSYAVDRAGTLWIATDEGIAHVEGLRLRMFREGIPAHTHVLSVAPADDGTLWLGTDKGLAHFQNGRFTFYGKLQGLPDDNLYQVAIDSQGALWIGGNQGIFTVKTSDLTDLDAGRRKSVPYTLYDASDGIRSFPFQGTPLHDQTGRLWFSGQQGITVVDPASLHQNNLPPPVLIEQVGADGKSLGAAQLAKRVSLPPGEGRLEVQYTGLSFEAPDKVKFRYQLVGFDADWVEAGTRRAAYYTNLAPGHYRFYVQACNNDGVWNRRGASFAFDLAPHFYQTTWFRVAVGLALLFLCTGLYLLRTRQLRRQNHLLETHVVERTASLVQAVATLKSQEEKLVVQNEELLNVQAELEAQQAELEAQNEELLATHLSLAESNARLEALATTDPLTGLMNHRSMVDALDAELARAARAERPCAVLFLDIDHFKALNDTSGHIAGDAALHEFAAITRECLRGYTVGRWGGEEFLALLPETGLAEAEAAAEDVRLAVAARTMSIAGGLRLTCSVGVAAYPTNGRERDALLQAADEAMYAAKRLGRNQVRTADDPAVGALCTEEAGTSREEEALAGTVEALAALVSARDSYSHKHTEEVGLMAVLLAQTLGLSGMEARQIGVAGRLHDIGKVAIPDTLLHKRDTLQTEEMEQMRRHPVVGAEVFSHVPGLRPLAPLIRSHHERWDGSGYPDGLAGEAIPLGARILAVADAYAAMTSDRPYHSAHDPHWALTEIERQAGTQFDPTVVSALGRILGHAEMELLAA